MSDPYNTLPSSTMPRHVTDEATGSALLVRYILREDVHNGIVCSVHPRCLQRRKKIQSTEPSVEQNGEVKPAFHSMSGPGIVLDSDVMNILSYLCVSRCGFG
jgi:hypothetical protein